MCVIFVILSNVHPFLKMCVLPTYTFFTLATLNSWKSLTINEARTDLEMWEIEINSSAGFKESEREPAVKDNFLIRNETDKCVFSPSLARWKRNFTMCPETAESENIKMFVGFFLWFKVGSDSWLTNCAILEPSFSEHTMSGLLFYPTSVGRSKALHSCQISNTS